MPEIASEVVTVLASPELLAEMEGGWSPLVRVSVERPKRPGGHWEMMFQTVNDVEEINV